MRFAHIVLPGRADSRLAVVDADDAIVVEDLFAGAPQHLEQLIAGGDDLLEPGRRAHLSPAPRHALADVRFDSAVRTPPVVLAIGLNYAAHSSELGLKTDSTPTVFALWPNSLAGHDSTTTWPRSLSESIDYEA